MKDRKDSPFAKDIKQLLAKVKAKKATEADKAKLEELRQKEKEWCESDEGFKPGNDFSWWNKVPELIKDAANLKSNWIAGTNLAGNDLPYTPFGVARILFTPAYGISKSATDPLNVWARDLYLRMFQKWRGISAYSASDLGIAIIAGIEVVRMIAKLERIYGVVNRYSKLNINMPYVECGALGISLAEADYIRGHLSDYRYDLNELIRKAQRLCVPKDMSILQDQISLLGYEYLDHDNAKGQIIIFDSDVFGGFTETNLSTGGMVRFGSTVDHDGFFEDGEPLIDTNGTYDNMFPALQLMLEGLLGSTSIQRIYGDLVTWFGESQMLEMKPLFEDYVIAPVYSESILHKMHNMECLDGAFVIKAAANNSMTSGDKGFLADEYAIYQFNDVIISAPYVYDRTHSPSTVAFADGWQRRATNSASEYGILNREEHPTIIDTYRADVTEETITEGVLFKCNRQYLDDSNSHYCMDLTSVAFEIITAIVLYKHDSTQPDQYSSQGVNTTDTNNTNVLTGTAFLAVLDWAPMCYRIGTGVNAGKIIAVYGDLDTPVPVYGNTKAKLHRSIIYSGLQSDVKVIA